VQITGRHADHSVYTISAIPGETAGQNETPTESYGNSGLAAIIAFYGLNGRRLTLTNDAAYDLVMGVAAGDLDSVGEIAAVLRQATRPAR